LIDTSPALNPPNHPLLYHTKKADAKDSSHHIPRWYLYLGANYRSEVSSLVYVVLLWSIFSLSLSLFLSLLLLLLPMHISTLRTTLLSIIVFIPLTCWARKQKNRKLQRPKFPSVHRTFALILETPRFPFSFFFKRYMIDWMVIFCRASGMGFEL